MRILLSYPVINVGVFYLMQDKHKQYHIVYDDETLGAYKSVQEAVDALVDNKTDDVIHYETKEVIDSSTLGIPRDYTEWDVD